MNITPELAGALLSLLKPKHAGGRPKGVKNSGPDRLAKTIVALNLRRSRMTTEQVDASERRVTRFLTKRFSGKEVKALGLSPKDDAVWRSLPLRRALMKLGIPKQELDVVVAYKRSEDRAGVGRLQLIDKTSLRRGLGYKTEPEPIVERSLDDDQRPVMLWGQDVTRAIREELCIEPAPRRRTGPGRRKLAPIEETHEFQIGRRKLVGAGSGENGRVVPTIVKEHGALRLSYAAEPTIGEMHQAELGRDLVKSGPESELYAEIDQVRHLPPLRKIRRWASFSLGGCHRAPEMPVVALPRSQHEITPGPADDPECWPEVQMAKAIARGRAVGLKARWLALGVLTGLAPRPAKLDVVYDLANVGWRQHLACRPTSIVWSEQGEPLKGSLEWINRRFRKELPVLS
jgi:hypothetical protein